MEFIFFFRLRKQI